ncbi:MAG: helix-turn-helix domain-containing protein [Candidatus Woesearchaeota archaeon]
MIEVLQRIGLTKNEIVVYTTLLDLGESKTGEILKKSGLNSGKIYEILDSLQKKGLVSYILKNKIKFFSPANPNRVLDYLDDKKKEINNQEESYKKILPDLLKKISAIKTEAKIEIFTGIQGLKTAYKKELEFSKKETLYVMGVISEKSYPKGVKGFFVNTHQPKREMMGYKIKKLLGKEAKKQLHEENAEIKYIPYTSLVSINVISNLSTIGIYSDIPIILSIESKDVAKSFIDQFNLLWNIAN